MDYNNINFLKSDQFNTIEIMISLTCERDFEKEFYLRFLLSILNSGTEKYKTKSELIKKTYDLYNASVFLSYKTYYKAQIVSLCIQTINPKFVHDENLLKDCITLGYDILYKPMLNKEKNGFDEKLFLECKKKLVANIKNIYNYKNTYANIKLLEHTRKEGELPFRESLDFKKVEEIKNSDLYDFYLKLINNCKVNIFASGDIDKDDVISALSSFDFKSKDVSMIETFSKKDFKIEKVKEVKEEQDISQTKLFMSFRTSICDNDAKNAALRVFNAMFGGMFTSTLSYNIREKQSLVYDISSSLLSTRKVMIVSSGNDKAKTKHIISEVLKELDNYKKGTIDDKESLLDRAKEALINKIKEENDDAMSRLNRMERVSMMPYLEPLTFIEKINAVKIEDVIDVSKTFLLDTIYILGGKENE